MRLRFRRLKIPLEDTFSGNVCATRAAELKSHCYGFAPFFSILPSVPCCKDITQNFEYFWEWIKPRKIYSRCISSAIGCYVFASSILKCVMQSLINLEKKNTICNRIFCILNGCSRTWRSGVQISRNFLGTLCQSILSPRFLMRSRSTDPLCAPSRP